MAARAAGFETRSPFAVADYARFFKSWLRWPSLAARLQILYLGRPLMSPAVIFQQLVRQTRRFVRAYKKLHDNVARDVNAAIKVVAARPAIDERKKGDLAEWSINSTARINYICSATVSMRLCIWCISKQSDRTKISIAISSIRKESGKQ